MSELRGVVGRLAAAIADGDPIEWSSVEVLAKSEREQALVRQLRAVASLERRYGSETFFADHRTGLSLLWSALLILASTQIVAAVVSPVVFAAAVPSRQLFLFQWAIASAFGVAALMLVWGGRDDSRPRRLAHVFLFSAAAFARPIISATNLEVAVPWFRPLLHGVYPESFLPLALWLFAKEFPRGPRFDRFDRASGPFAAVLAVVCGFLFAASWAVAIRSGMPNRGLAWLQPFARTDPRDIFSILTLSLMLPSLVTSMWRIRTAPRDERSRSLWFLFALAAGVLPILLVGVLLAPTAFEPVTISNVSWRQFLYAFVLVCLLSVPFTTGYVILAHRVLTVRLVVRASIRWALARYTLLTIIAAPVIVPIQLAYQHRDRRVDELFADPRTLICLAVMAFGFILLTCRRRLLAALDRRLLGGRSGQTDLTRATTALSQGRTVREIVLEVSRQLAEALDISRVAVLLRQRDGSFVVVHGSSPPLHQDSALIAILAKAPAVILASDTRLFGLLPARDREWLVRGRFEALGRMPMPHQDVAGIVAVAARNSGIGFSKDDLAVMSAIAATAGLACHRPWLDVESQRDTDPAGDGIGAVECETCGIIADTKQCDCRGSATAALLPRVLAGKFEVLRRLGHGGMGVVYLAHDLRLGRPVALKTLPRVSPAAAAAMLVEAKTMAQVDHPNLALIYDIEMWRDTPVLIVEYLAGGMLAAHLAREAFPIDRALQLGAALADALATLHGAGILHRDIKPSNVGFTRSLTPKLLDFGVARLIRHADPTYEVTAITRADTVASVNTAVAGTPLYLSPEALSGSAPDVSFDLWGLSLLVLEAIVGAYPFSGRTSADVLTRIRRGQAVAAGQWRTRLPPGIVELFDRALAADPRRRPQSATALAADFRQCMNGGSHAGNAGSTTQTVLSRVS